MPGPVNVDVAALSALGQGVTGMAPQLEAFGRRTGELAALLRRAVGNGGQGDEITSTLVEKFQKVDNMESYLSAFASALRGTGDGTVLAARMFADADDSNAAGVQNFNSQVSIRV